MAIALWSSGNSTQPSAAQSNAGRIQTWSATNGPQDAPKATLAAQRKKKDDEEAQRRKQQEEAAKQNSLFSKIKRGAKSMADEAGRVGAKTINTLEAGQAGVLGATKATGQAIIGDAAGANKTAAATNRVIAEKLDKGTGGQGGYLSSKQAASRGGGAKGYKDNFVKPVAQATTDIVPYVAPVGKVAKGATLLTKVARGAVDNAILSASTTAANEAIQGRLSKDDGSEIVKSAVIGGVVGGVIPGLHGAGKAAANQLETKTAQKALTTAKQNTLLDAARKTKPGQEPLPATATLQAPDLPPAPNTIPQAILDEQPSALGATESATPTVGLPHEAAPAQPQPVRAQSVAPDGNSSTPIVARPEHVQAVNDFIARAHIEHPVFQQTMQSVAKGLGLKYHGGPVKDAGRALTKVMEDYGGDHTKLKDSVRGTIEVPDHSEAGFQKVIDTIKETYPDAVVKDGYKNYKNGYVDMKVTVQTPGGHTAEIILATPEMLQAKNKLGGHTLYEIWRDTSKSDGERKAAHEQMMVLYDNAHASANKRLATSGDKAYSDSKTRAAAASDTGSAPGRTPGTRLVEPVKTTVSKTKSFEDGRTASTTSPSYTKKEGLPISTSLAEKGENVKHKPETEVGKPKSLLSKTTTKPKESKRLTPTETAHMEPIGGYTHSSNLEQDYADMLRGQEKDATVTTVPDGKGGYKRVTEHSKFFREYYKENGKPPTKADYLEEAKRHLMSGKDAYGASKEYKQLLEREAKPIPQQKVNTTPIAGNGEVLKSTLGSKVEANAVSSKLTKKFGDLPQYSKLDMKQQGKDATELLINDEQKAIDIALGRADPPAHLTPEAVYIAVEAKALATGDVELIRALAKSDRVSEATVMGQRIRVLGEREQEGPIVSIQKVTKAREKALEARTGKTVAKNFVETQREIKAARAAVPKVTKETFASFVESLKC